MADKRCVMMCDINEQEASKFWAAVKDLLVLGLVILGLIGLAIHAFLAP